MDAVETKQNLPGGLVCIPHYLESLRTTQSIVSFIKWIWKRVLSSILQKNIKSNLSPTHRGVPGISVVPLKWQLKPSAVQIDCPDSHAAVSALAIDALQEHSRRVLTTSQL